MEVPVLLLIFAGTVTVVSSARDVESQVQKLSNVQEIVGGQDASTNEYPWMAALYYRGSFTCGGSLVKGTNNNYYILTAAHCISRSRRRSGRYRVYLGSLTITTRVPASAVRVNRVYIHPRYRSRSFSWDIGLLRLSSTPALSAQISPGSITAIDFTADVDSIVTGWGRTSEGGPLSLKLQELNSNRIFSHTACQNMLGRYYRSSNMMCAGFLEAGKGSCNGDSGGPLMVNRNGTLTIVGIVNWGYGCAIENLPPVYSNVYKSLDFINGIING